MAAIVAPTAVFSGLAVKSAGVAVSQKLRSSFTAAAAPRSVAGDVGRVTMVAARDDWDFWLPGITPPAHLDGSLAGDRGFDPLNIATEAPILNRYVEGEIINGRWAMLAVAGALTTEILGLGNFGETARSALSPDGAPVFGLLPIAIPLSLIGFAGVGTIGIAEGIRLKAQLDKGYDSIDGVYSNVYPGFDPLGLVNPSKSAEEIKSWRTKEVKNGRLAMIAFIGFVWQYILADVGPVEALLKHLSDPHVNWIFGKAGI